MNRFLSNYLLKLIINKSFNKRKIKGRNNIILNNGLFYKCKLKIIGDYNKIIIGKNAKIKKTNFIIIGNGNEITIGDNCIYSEGGFWIEDNNNKINFGEDSTAASANIQIVDSNNSVIIGKDCMFSYDIEIKAGDSHSIIDINSNKRINHSGSIFLEDHVWVGAHVVILKGVSIGSNSIIGSNSVCTKSCPQNVIVAGVPAKVIKSNVGWLRKRI